MADKKNGTQGARPAAATEPVRKRNKITKVEAVGRAIAALGEEASRGDIQGYVRQKFGVKIGLDHISNCKGELAKRAAKATTPGGLQQLPRNRQRLRRSPGSPWLLQRGLLSRRRPRAPTQPAATGRPP